MADHFKLDDLDRCPTCNKESVQGQHVRCFSCKCFFHVICDNVGEDKVATKTMITSFLQTSTRKNFVFYCDECLTKIEIKSTETDKERIDNLEGKMTGINRQLEDIKKLLAEKEATPVKEVKAVKSVPHKDNLWANKERLESVRAPEPKAKLIINKESNENKNKETKKND